MVVDDGRGRGGHRQRGGASRSSTKQGGSWTVEAWCGAGQSVGVSRQVDGGVGQPRQSYARAGPAGFRRGGGDRRRWRELHATMAKQRRSGALRTVRANRKRRAAKIFLSVNFRRLEAVAAENNINFGGLG